MAKPEDFSGAWKLVSFRNEAEDGTVNMPFGENPSGMIYYDSSGFMGVHIMPQGRPKFASGDMFEATGEEMKEAIRFIGYSGRFDIRENVVVHKIEISLFPNWVGREQERFYQIDGKRLTLSTKPMKFGGKRVISRLVWERVG